MSYNTLLYIDSQKEVPSFDKSIVFSPSADGFCFAITSVRGELLTFGQIQHQEGLSMSDQVGVIKSVLEEHKIATFGFSQCCLMVDTQQYTWIPDHLFEAGKERKYLEMLTPIALGQGIYTYHSNAIGAQLVFTADTTMVSAFKIAIPKLQICCQQVAFVTEGNLQQSDLRSAMYLNIRKGYTDIIVLCNKKLLFGNTFATANTEESLYYALNIMSQLHLEEAQLRCFVCGNIDRFQYSTMAQFLPQLDLYTGRKLTMGCDELYTLKTYQYPTLLS